MSRTETLKNNATTTLDGAINDSVTSVTVSDGSVFPSEGDFRVIVDDEIMLVTARSGNTLTVVRASESTVGAAHNSGDDITQILTEEAVEQYIKQTAQPLHQHSPSLRIYDPADGSLAVVADFTWVNQGSSTAADVNGFILFKGAAGAGADVHALVVSAPTAPYTLTAAVSTFHELVSEGSGQPRGGLVFRESGTGKLLVFMVRQITGTAGITIVTQRFTDPTTFSSEVDLTTFAIPPGMIWLRIENDDTDLKFYASSDGVNWKQAYTEGKAAFFTTAPDQIGFGTNASHITVAPWLYVHSFLAE